MVDDNSASNASEGEQPGPLQRLDSVAPDGWRMKFAKAAAQLIAGSERGAAVYGEVRERLDTIEGRSIVSKGIAEAVMRQAVADPVIMERAKARFLASTLQKQVNLEAVIDGASAQALLQGPPVNTQSADDAPVEDEVKDGKEPLDTDWASTFTSVAENATSDELRDRLSRVLAGELRSPGTYSRSMVRRISELDKEDLEAMRRVSRYVIDDMIIKVKVGDASKPSIDDLFPLVEAGLIVEASDLISRMSPVAAQDGEEAWLAGKSCAIKVTLKAGHRLDIPMSQLTRTGIAVADLLGRVSEEGALKEFADSLPEEVYSSIGIGQIFSPGKVRLPLSPLKPIVSTNVLNPASGERPVSYSPSSD